MLKDALLGLRQILASSLKMMKHAFHFTLKVLVVAYILRFCLDFLAMRRNSLIRKIRLISKSMASQPGEQAIAVHILLNISKSKGNQAMKFGQLREHNTRSIFLEKHTHNVVKKLFSDPFLKSQNLACLWINGLKFRTVCFYCGSSWGVSKCIEIKLQNTCCYLT